MVRYQRDSGGLGLLQMVLELDNKQCTSEDVGPLREVDYEISHRLEMRMMYSLSGSTPLPTRCVLKP